jgi:hypothetical protein
VRLGGGYADVRFSCLLVSVFFLLLWFRVTLVWVGFFLVGFGWFVAVLRLRCSFIHFVDVLHSCAVRFASVLVYYTQILIRLLTCL